MATLCALLDATASARAIDLQQVRIDPETGLLRDTYGRTRIFHGVNVVYKKAPWYPPSAAFSPEDSLDNETMDNLRSWGFNVVRLGVMWPGVEPAPGSIDLAYLAEMRRLAEELARRGVYTMVDLHQDIGSRRFCGEGFPEHYIDELERDPTSTFSRAAPFPAPLPMRPPAPAANGTAPLLENCLQHSFTDYYLTEKVGSLWKELYTPASSLQEGFLRFWRAVANAFVGKPYIVGYELLNEPSGWCLEGDALSCAVQPIGNDVETRHLTPLYQAAAEAIRAIDPRTPIWYEPAVLPKVTDVFKEKPLGNDTQQGLAYHIYCQPGDGAGPMSAAICYMAQDLFTTNYFSWLRRFKGVGGFMTEFGAIGDTSGELLHLQRLLRFADDAFQSWTYWMLKKFGDFTTANAAESLYDEHGELEVPKLKALSRTYAPAIGGTPTRMAFDPDTGAFELVFVASVRTAPTVLYVNEELHYPHGYDVEVTPTGCLNMRSLEKNYVELGLAASARCFGAVVTVQVHRKAPANGQRSPQLLV
uniref:Glycoside hydrolase family 5 domain-containing protein n=1 Tax=Zooxanthella nutricula TaxID=1333877 RepID=A0A7S2L1Z6_9DINO